MMSMVILIVILQLLAGALALSLGLTAWHRRRTAGWPTTAQSAPTARHG